MSRAKEWRRFFEEVKWSKTQTPKELQRVKEYLAKGDLGWADRALVEAGFKLPMDTDPFETIFFMVWILSRMKDLPVPLKYVSLKDADTGREEWKSVFVAATRCKMLLVSSPPVSTILQTTKRVPKGTFAFSYTDLTETRMSPQHLSLTTNKGKIVEFAWDEPGSKVARIGLLAGVLSGNPVSSRMSAQMAANYSDRMNSRNSEIFQVYERFGEDLLEVAHVFGGLAR